MNLKQKLGTVAAALGLALSGMAATAVPAAAVGGCPAGRLCLYENINYIDLDVTMASTKACIYLSDFGEHRFGPGIGSYVNNLGVKAEVFHWVSGTSYALDGTIRPGGFSSNSTNGGLFGNYGMVCTGGARP
ncbi:proteinase inhibitor I36 SMPI [Streptomyces sp. NPDC048383]|uniref:proteinase inhibitor I36 SMPI n=1 Tax=Streptomyces sp. NPDC048383 TaxID=3155386 RepID=UPI00341AA17B